MTYRRMFITCVTAAFLGAVFVTGAGADVQILLRNGKSLSVPVQKDDIVAIQFTEDAGEKKMINYALSANGGRVITGFTAWGTPRTLVNDGNIGPDDPNPNGVTKDGIAAYSYGTESFQVEFNNDVRIERIGIMHKYGGGGGARHTIRRARLVFSDGTAQEIELQPKYALQYVDVLPTMTRSIRVEPLAFYEHSDPRWGIVEFEALGAGR